MTYIEIVNHFWNENRVNRCDPYEVALFFYILNEANKQRWVDQIKISTNILTAELGISRKTLINTRKKLKDKNLINFEPGLKNKLTSVYTIYVSDGNIQRNIQGNIEGNILGNIQGNILGNHLIKNKNKNKNKKYNNSGDASIDIKLNEGKKKEVCEDVFLFDNEIEKLINEYGDAGYNRMIDILSNYKGSTGKKYKSDYKAILNWVVKRFQEEKVNPKKSNPLRDNFYSNTYAKELLDKSDLFDKNGMLKRIPIIP